MIPRHFHQIWIGPPLPARYAEWAERWRELHPEWGYTLWDDEMLQARTWTFQSLMCRTNELAPDHHGQFVSDLMRLEILLSEGGVYIDTDQEPLKPIDPLLDGVTAFAGWEMEPAPGRRGWVSNGVMGATPDHPWIMSLVANLPAHVQHMSSRGVKRPNRLTGPKYITPLTQGRTDVRILPKDTFYPYLWNELHRNTEAFPDSYAVHHWNNMRREKGVPL